VDAAASRAKSRTDWRGLTICGGCVAYFATQFAGDVCFLGASLADWKAAHDPNFSNLSKSLTLNDALFVDLWGCVMTASRRCQSGERTVKLPQRRGQVWCSSHSARDGVINNGTFWRTGRRMETLHLGDSAPRRCIAHGGYTGLALGASDKHFFGSSVCSTPRRHSVSREDAKACVHRSLRPVRRPLCCADCFNAQAKGLKLLCANLISWWTVAMCANGARGLWRRFIRNGREAVCSASRPTDL